MTTTNRIYGVWASAADFSAGHGPTAVDESRNLVMAGARDVLKGRSMLLASSNQPDLFDDWQPVVFFSANRQFKINDKQKVKYMAARSKNLDKMAEANAVPESAQDGPISGADEAPPVEDAANSGEGQLVLTLSADIVKLLASTFNLVREGHAVTIVQQATEQG